MAVETSEIRSGEVSLEKARLELERLLSDDRFRVSDRQRDILRYLAERRLAGCESGVKAYSIALDVLGRPSGFDAANDPIVRIEISRLRTSLESYYGVFGADLGVSVYIPKGSYLTLFLKTPDRGGVDDLSVNGGLPAPLRDSVRVADVRRPSRPRWKWLLVAGAAVSVALLLVTAGTLYLLPNTTSKPSVTLAMTAVSADLNDEAAQTTDMLLTALTQFQTVVVAKPSLESSRSLGVFPRYDVEMKYYGTSDDHSVWWQIVDRMSGELLKSGVETVEISGRSPAAVREEITGILARRIAATHGVVNTFEVQSSPKGALGNACVLRAEYALDEGGSRGIAAASLCLERTLARTPDDPDANALLSRILLAPRDRAIDAATRARSLELAKRAVLLAPLSDRAQTALMIAHFLDGRTDAAIEAGNRAMALNPNNPDAAASLGLVLFSAGYWKAGVDLAQTASNESDTPPRDAMVVLALDAYRNGNWSEASLLSDRVNCTDFIVRAVRAAASGQLGATDANALLNDVKGSDHNFEDLFRDRMATARMRPEIVADLEAGLSKAGANFPTVISAQQP